MTWSIDDRFPNWGETGEFPPAGFFYDGGDQVNEKHLDALWNGLNELEEDVQAALNDIDSNNDGIVDKAEAGAAGFDLGGDLLASGGEVVWDESNNYIPQDRLQNDTITASAGDGLKGGGQTPLGNSFNFDIEPADFAGAGLSDDGSDNLTLVNNSVTVAGNTVSLGSATGISLGDLSNVTATGEGSGNGFDADQVDGLDASDLQFLAASETDDGSDITVFSENNRINDDTIVNITGSGICLGGKIWSAYDSSSTSPTAFDVTVDNGITFSIPYISHQVNGGSNNSEAMLPPIKFESSFQVDFYAPGNTGAQVFVKQ